MNSDSFERSQNLRILAERLRQYKRDPKFDVPFNKTRTNQSTHDPLENSECIQYSSSIQSESIKPNRAAVLICLFEGKNGEIRVVLTRRSSTISSHSGEVALPGGKMEEGDADDIETALREAKEEIGLDPSAVDVVTVLEPFNTKRNIVVVPVVGILWDNNAFNPVQNADEVEAIFDAPLEMFLKDENRRAEEREWMGNKYVLHFFDHQVDSETYVIWALTAGILIKAAIIVYNRPPAFEEHRPMFWNRSRQ